MKDSKSNDYLDNLLLGLNERFDVRPAGPPPDIKALHAAMKAGKIKKNPFHLDAEKPNRKSTPHSFIYHLHSKPSKNFSGENFDYRKSDPPLYSSKNADLSEPEILSRLNQLLQENEVSGLDSAEIKELSDLQKKVK